MAAQKGSAMLIAVGDGGGPETFTTVGGLRTKTISINSETVEITDSDSTNRMRELLAAAGTISVSVSGSGVFKDSAAEATVRTNAMAQTVDNWQITIPDFGTFTGPFQVTTLEYAGEYNGELTYDVSLESGGDIVFATI